MSEHADLAELGHRIRTSLSGVLGMSSLLLRTELDEHQRRLAEVIRSSGETLLTEIDELLERVSARGAADPPGPPRPADPHIPPPRPPHRGIGTPEHAGPARPDAGATRGGDGAQGARALIIDDHPVNREVALALLTSAGWTCDEAVDGAEALAMAGETPYDLILIDRWLPGMDGIAAVSEIREIERVDDRRPARIVGWTADPRPDELEAWRHAGIDAWVPKPLTEEALATLSDPASLPESALAPSARGSALPRVDEAVFGALGAFSGGDPAFVPGLVRTYASDARERYARIRAAVADGDPALVRSLAHALKGASRHMGALELGERAYGLEQAADRGELPDAEALDELDDIVEGTLAEIARLEGRGPRGDAGPV